ncbi:HAD family hydrolase [Oscillospiraceae bacterium PP1C4]
MNKVVAFDLDGTLSQSERFLIPSYREALMKVGITPPPDEVLKNMIGGTLDDNIKIAMPGRTMEEFLVYADHVHVLAAKYAAQYGAAYPGIPESLALLRERGYKIAICSNGTEDYIDHILEGLDLKKHFDFIQHIVVGCNKSQLLKRILDKFETTEVVMVGDRHFDETAARDNHVPFIGCAYGIYPDEVAGADVVLQNAYELPAAVEKLLG